MAPRHLPLLLLLALLGAWPGELPAQQPVDEGVLVQLTRADAEDDLAEIDRLLGWSETGPVLKSGPGPSDWMRMSFPLARREMGRELATNWTLEYSNGLRTAGRPQGGNADQLDWAIGDSQHLLIVPIDLLALRGFGRDRVPTAPAEQEEDLLVLRTASGLDRRSGWLEEITSEGLVFAVGERVESHAWEKIEGLRLLEEEELRPVQGEVVIRLMDGSFLPFLPRTVEPERWRGRLPWGAKLQIPREWVRSMEPAVGPFVDLTELPTDSVAFESGQVLRWQPRLHQSVSGRPLRVGGQSYARGYGVRAPTSLRWQLDGPGLLTVEVGVDEEVIGHRDPAPLRFEVLLDGKLLAERAEVQRSDGALGIRVRVPQAGVLELRCTSQGEATASGRHGNWLAPRFWQLSGSI